MSWLQALTLAIVEGLTEFLPVSSTAQLLLVEKMWPVANLNLFSSFAIFIQLGAMLAVLLLFAKRVWQAPQIWLKLLITIVPTLALGALAYPLVKEYLQDASPLTGWILIGGGLFFTGLDWYWQKKAKKPSADYVKEVQATAKGKLALVGVAQATAMVPGVSRSAATIFGGRAIGLSQKAAAELSFVVALPTIAAAAGLDLVKEWLNKDVQVICDCVAEPCICPEVYSVFDYPSDLWLMGLGFAVAFAVAFLTSKFLIKFLGERPFWYWGVFRVVTGLAWLII